MLLKICKRDYKSCNFQNSKLPNVLPVFWWKPCNLLCTLEISWIFTDHNAEALLKHVTVDLLLALPSVLRVKQPAPLYAAAAATHASLYRGPFAFIHDAHCLAV